MSRESDCPTPDELSAFVLGKVATLEALLVQNHLESCSACREKVQSLQSLSWSTLATPADEGVQATNANLQARQSSTATGGGYSFLLPPVRSDEIGRLGNYRVLHLLGQGGMGMVFQAEDIGLLRPVALKVMRPEMQANADGWQRFLREARALAKFKHDHLVTIFQAGEERGIAYFAMELLEGESLESWMKRVPRPDFSEIVRIGREIAAGLAFIHQKNLIHRDLKPANVWLEAPRRRVKILDLGVVHDAMDAKLTMTGVIMGTPDFMSPEQARGDAVDARSDLFSLGCILYFLCAGRKPFQGQTCTAVLMALASETPQAVVEINPAIPSTLSSLVMQMLDRNPNKRPASADEVVQWLTAIEKRQEQAGLSTQPIQLAKRPKEGILEPTPPKKQKKATREREEQKLGSSPSLWAAGILAGLLMLAGFFYGTFWLWPQAAPPEKPVADQKIFLRDLKSIAAENWPFRKGPEFDPWKEPKKKNPKEKPPGKDFDVTVRFKGVVLPHGIFMHPPVPPFEGNPASISYRLGKEFRKFHAEVSLNDGQGEANPCIFWVYGDGIQLWKSKEVSRQQNTQQCEVSVKDVDVLKLAVTCRGDPRGAHAIWIDPCIEK